VAHARDPACGSGEGVNEVAEPIVKQCSCKRTYTRAQWDALKYVGTQTHDWGEVHELRNCVCRTTLVLVLEKGEEQDPEEGARWQSRWTGRVIVITKIERGAMLPIEYRYVGRRRRQRVTVKEFYQAFTPEKGPGNG